ncbi:MAG TPA: penicillin-binding protein 2 [Actinomycetota bacterium]|nr:penicillin-binding protein 2 [Actinomycetota bacterium]
MSNHLLRSRLSVIHLLTVSLLVTLVARLLFLQVLAGPQLRESAERTSIRLIYSAAPRGFIFDRDGDAIARNRTAVTVAIDVSVLPADPAIRDRVLPALAKVLDMDESDVRDVVEDPQLGYYEPRPLAVDVPMEKVVYLLEHQARFPGISALEIPVREYPNGVLAAHVVGHVGRINAQELEERQKAAPDADDEDAVRRRYRANDQIGKIGVERVYEDWLRGTPGLQKIAVNVRGERVQQLRHLQAERGWDAVLTLQDAVQQAAEEGLLRGTEIARRIMDPDTGENYKAPAGAVVALDPRDGEVLALASYPTFDPNLWVGKVPQEEIDRINDPESHQPQFNRAISSTVAPGSTFKPMTLAAAWEASLVEPESTFNCPGFFQVGTRRFRDWDPKGHGQVGLTRSLVESCDVVYYTIGVEMNERRQEIGEHLQETARKFGFGTKTGIDLLGEREGLVPGEQWKQERFSYAQPYDRRWFPGDAANLAIGQGFLQVTPLQLAVAYAALSNGGHLVRPHVMRCLSKLNVSELPADPCQAPDSIVPDAAKPRAEQRIRLNPTALEFISQSMEGVGLGEGTAAAVFADFPFDRVTFAGKTGTAQVAKRQDFSWFAAFAPARDPEIVVVAMVEEGGTGAQIAAPIVKRVLEAHFGLEPGNFSAGTRAD